MERITLLVRLTMTYKARGGVTRVKGFSPPLERAVSHTPLKVGLIT